VLSSEANSSIFLQSATIAADDSENFAGEKVPRQSETTKPAVSRGKRRANDAPWIASDSAACGASKEQIKARPSFGEFVTIDESDSVSTDR
jgi:hypothetical protein